MGFKRPPSSAFAFPLYACMATEAPIFIVGPNRSGTTLLRLMLNAHSRIAVPDELVYFRGEIAGAMRDEWTQPDLSPDAFRQYVRNFLQRNREALAPLSANDLEEAICASGPFTLRHPYAETLDQWAAAHGKARWGEKTPGNLFYVDVIHDMFPNARFVYMARDPRAGVHSMLKTSFFRGDAVINALNRRKYDRNGLQHLRRSVPEEQWTVLRFEDLVQEPEATLRSLCTFLQEDFEPGMLSYHETSQKYMNQRAVNRFNKAATRPVSAKKAASWRTGLSEIQVAEVEWICRHEMDAFGYERDGHSLPLSRRVKGWLKIAYWHLQNWRHRHAPQFILQDRVLQRSRTRLKSVFNRAIPATTSTQ